MSDQVDRSVLPIRRPPFAGVAAKTLGDSRPDWGLIGGVGLVVGLFAPPLLASVVVGDAAGALVGKFARHRVESGHGAKKLKAARTDAQAGLGG